MLGELTKLKIIAFEDSTFKNEVGAGVFITTINPDSYSISHKIEHNTVQAQATSGLKPKYTRTLPEDLDFSFLFDRTGALSNNSMFGESVDEIIEDSGLGVLPDIENFKRVTLNYNGTNHQPNYLIISWGTLLFKGIMTSLNINYKLFKSTGIPIRAEAKAHFKSIVDDGIRAAIENRTSPDLTHRRIVKEGDNLPLMTHRIYGDSKYYLEVAKANKIQNFRKLQVGQEIIFPPFNKE